jgi:ribosome-associated protein
MDASKSEKKREYLALQALGEQLVALSEEQLREMQLDERLFDAVTAAATIKARGALRRQHQLIGKLMRSVDPEPIRAALQSLRRQETADKERFRQAERWRDRIVKEGQTGLNEFFEASGRPCEELESLLQRYLDSRTDTERKALRRKMFRKVREELTMQKAPG